MFNKKDPKRQQCMLTGKFRKKGYDWWWHSFTAINRNTKEEKAFFAEFFLINPALGGSEPIFGQLKENKEKGIKPSYLMVKCGTWGHDAKQLHRFFGWNEIKVHMGVPYQIEAKDCYLDNERLRLKVEVKDSINHPEWMSSDGSIEMELTMSKEITYNVGYGASGLFRCLKAYEMYWHAEGIKTKYFGTIIYNGEVYDVIPDKSYGYQDKNWGSNFTTPWVWLSSNCLKSNITGNMLSNSAFEIGGGKPKVFGISLDRKLLGCMYYEGKEMEFNFSKFWTGSKTSFSCGIEDGYMKWHVLQSTKKYIMESEIKCKLDEMLLVNYEDPNGDKRHNNLYNGGTGTGNIKIYEKRGKEKILIDDIDASHIGCEYGEFDK